MLTKEDFFNVGGIWHHRDDDVCLTGYFSWASTDDSSTLSQLIGHFTAGTDKDGMTSSDQMACHWGTHNAQTHKTEL